MRIRHGFVSNSSSCSFVVIGKGALEVPYLSTSTLNVPYSFGGETDFGRSYGTETDMATKLNWAFLQAMAWPGYEYLTDYELNNPFWKLHDVTKFGNLTQMLRNILKAALGVKRVHCFIDPCYDEEPSTKWILEEGETVSPDTMIWLKSRLTNGSIDHGSLWTERIENLAIFSSTSTLEQFLFCPESRIELRSD